MPGRKYTAASSSYRYGFNGKENDNEVKGEGNQQDYGMRIYDPRLGRFLSVDPITKEYPELTPYQFASNRPVDGIDMDGLEYVKSIPKFEYNGSWTDYPAAIDNGIINVLNLIPETWNSAVANYQSLRKGTWTKDVGGELKQIGKGAKDYAVNSWTYTANTPIKQQFVDAGKTLVAPQTVETLVTFYVSSKIPFSSGKGNLLKTETTTSVTTKTVAAADAAGAAESNAALAARYAKNRPTFRQGTINKVWEAAKDANGKVFDPNTFEELTWDKFKSRYDQWHMGHKPGFEYRKLVERLKNGGINQKQFLDEYNTPTNYRPESPSANVSHKYEAPKAGG